MSDVHIRKWLSPAIRQTEVGTFTFSRPVQFRNRFWPMWTIVSGKYASFSDVSAQDAVLLPNLLFPMPRRVKPVSLSNVVRSMTPFAPFSA